MTDQIPSENTPTLFGQLFTQALIAVTVFGLPVSDQHRAPGLVWSPSLKIKLKSLSVLKMKFVSFYRHWSILSPKAIEAQVEIFKGIGYPF